MTSNILLLDRFQIRSIALRYSIACITATGLHVDSDKIAALRRNAETAKQFAATDNLKTI
ncbi:MAG: hypothetical protein CMJ19_23710 [Phycisphaeraceae bacterium]|nr:hypothetical protein [Phycisphaeraceae bacterium]